MTRNKFTKKNYCYVDNVIISKILANVIRQKRLDLGISSRQLSLHSGVNRNTVIRIEKSCYNIYLENLLKIAVTLDIPMCELWFEVDHFCKYGCLSNGKTELIFDESEKEEDEDD